MNAPTKAALLSTRRLVRMAWTPEQDARVRAEFPGGGGPALAREFGCSVNAVQQRAKKLGVRKARVWDDPANVAMLRELYPMHTSQHVAAVIGCRWEQVQEKAWRLGIKKDPAFFSEVGKALASSPLAQARRFKKGHETWNKDMKGLQLSPNTQFKPGTRHGMAAKNWLPIGSNRMSKEGYMERKIADSSPAKRSNFVPVHHLVWRMHGQTVPRGHVLIFIDGDKNNPDINNLTTISRAENMARNSIHRLPDDVRELCMLKTVLKRTINGSYNGNRKAKQP